MAPCWGCPITPAGAVSPRAAGPHHPCSSHIPKSTRLAPKLAGVAWGGRLTAGLALMAARLGLVPPPSNCSTRPMAAGPRGPILRLW